MQVRPGGDVCRTSLPTGKDRCVCGSSAGGYSHQGRQVFWELGISLDKSRASCPPGCPSSPVTPGVFPWVPCAGTNARSSPYRPGRVP